MPRYIYTAKSLIGEPRVGTAEAKNEHELARALRREGFVLIKAESEKKEKIKRKFAIDISAITGVSLVEKMMFVKNLRIMISAGISLPRALQTLAVQAKTKKLRTALLGAAEEVMKGKSFSESLSNYPSVFSEIFQNMIAVGEEAGTLEEVLGILNKQMEREHELRSKIRGAMMYPAVIITAMIGIGILMLGMVVPKLAETFKELDIELPFTTKIVIGIGNFIANFWYLIPLIVLAIVLFFMAILRTKKGKKAVSGLFLRTPFVSQIIKKTNSAYTARTLSSLIVGGVPIVKALEIISRSVGNIYFQEAMADASQRVKKGGKLSEVLKNYQKIYPLLIIQMAEIGEETGQTSDIFQKLADFYEEEVTNSIKNLSSIIEPVLMLIIGAAIGFFAVSMVQPMYSMLQAF